MNRKLLSAALVGVLAVGAAGAALASMAKGADNDKEAPEMSDAAALAKARVSLTQAIAAAEQKTGGRAVEAALEGEDDGLVFEVAVLNGSAEQEVIVDALSGAVKSVGPGESESDDERGEDRD
jgi:uncharacterized membrane protein YkoI